MPNQPLTLTRCRSSLKPLALSLALLLACHGPGALAAEMEMEMAGHEHEHHHHAMAESKPSVQRSEATYALPTLNLVRQDGKPVDFIKEVDDGRPVILNFVYTSCTAICPVTSQVMAQVQEMLLKDRQRFHMLSISIDPEYDTPARLSAYAKKFGATPQWQFYSGTEKASVAMQKAFNVYLGDKMNHLPVTFVRAAPGKPWVRLDGFASPEAVLHEFHQLSES